MIEFAVTSDNKEDPLSTFVIQASAQSDDDGYSSHLLSVMRLDGEWHVSVFTEKGEAADIKWEEFLKIVYRFSEFVAQENSSIIRGLMSGKLPE